MIYLDNAATTKVDEKVVGAMLPYFSKKFGNASSAHIIGFEAERALEKSRKIIAKKINAKTKEIIFTSGGTESNNLALKGLFLENAKKFGKNHVITSKIEHDCILKTCKWLETQGADVTYLDVDKEGFIDLNQLKKSITPKTLVVSIIHGNNEIGTIQDIEKIGKICKNSGVYFHTDACQSFLKTELDVKKQHIDLVTLNAHKIQGPKGVGALYIREGIKITPLAHGGGHEHGLRSGTENIPGIIGFAKAVEIFSKRDIKKMVKLRDNLIKGILQISNTKLNGPNIENNKSKRLCNNVNVSFENIEGEAIGGLLSDYGIYTSTGSACMSHSLEPSHVLRALGLSHLHANSSIRLSLSKETTEKDIKFVLKVLPKAVKKLRRFSPFAK